MKTLLFAIAALALWPIGALAQSTALPSVMGYISTSGCPGSKPSCFVQYGSSVPTGGGAASVGYANQPNTPAVTVTGSSTSVVAARTGASGTGRGLLILVNTTANAAWCTSGTASVNSGTFLAGTIGASINLPFTGAESCIAVGSSAIVSVTELY